MDICINCNTALNPKDRFCQVCGTSRYGYQSRQQEIILTVLCILTIIGSVLQIIRGLFYETVSQAADNHEYFRGWIYALTAVVTLAGAIMMISKKLYGLYVYTAGQAVYLLTTLYATSVYTSDDQMGDMSAIAIFISSLFIIPAVVMLILFWIPANRRSLS